MNKKGQRVPTYFRGQFICNHEKVANSSRTVYKVFILQSNFMFIAIGLLNIIYFNYILLYYVA